MTVPPSPLVTDLYQLTMAQGYWQTGVGLREVCFDTFFRSNPFGGGYTVVAGLEEALEFLENLRFFKDELRYLESLDLFTSEFLEHLEGLRFTGDVHAMAEGTVAFAHEPVVRVTGRLEECQLVESALLNVINFQSLVATKACRVCLEAGEDNVMEFGLRRAQGVDGALTAARAAYIGGCSSTSNLHAGRRYSIPVRGAHAHSWVMAFEDELTSFRRFVEIYGSRSVLLVDTYDTLASGVPNAIRVARELAEQGLGLEGIRIDSGDMALLSREARRMLDEAGFEDVEIVCSGDLDEYAIRTLRAEGACIDSYGVGTHLVTARDEPALPGVYKLAAVRTGDGSWTGRIKLTDDPGKATLPGLKQVWRLVGPENEMVADWMDLEGEEPDTTSGVLGCHLSNLARMELIKGVRSVEPMLKPVMREGKVVADLPPLERIRARVRSEVMQLPEAVRKLVKPRQHTVLAGPRLLEEARALRARM